MSSKTRATWVLSRELQKRLTFWETAGVNLNSLVWKSCLINILFSLLNESLLRLSEDH
jgi:hypothetical protein